MINKFDNKEKTRPNAVINKLRPRLSLNIHTMPQTSDGYFKKWLFLGALIFILMVFVAILVLW